MMYLTLELALETLNWFTRGHSRSIGKSPSTTMFVANLHQHECRVKFEHIQGIQLRQGEMDLLHMNAPLVYP